MEGIHPERIFHVGDTMLDILRLNNEKIGASKITSYLGLNPKEFILLTTHRPENVDSPRKLGKIVNMMMDMDYEIIFPVHPRTRKNLQDYGYWDLLTRSSNVLIHDPLSYTDTQRLILDAGCLITDSGGMQKEAFWLKTPCITIRESTEWIETIETGANILVGVDLQAVKPWVNRFMKGEINPNIFEGDPYGEGFAAEIVLRTLLMER
jgi:UDP-N-acetylglucosamine 2-epimerase (non-hydrolysing)